MCPCWITTRVYEDEWGIKRDYYFLGGLMVSPCGCGGLSAGSKHFLAEIGFALASTHPIANQIFTLLLLD